MCGYRIAIFLLIFEHPLELLWLYLHLVFLCLCWKKWYEYGPDLLCDVRRSLSYPFNLNPFSLPLSGKPVDSLWDQALLNKLSFHLFLLCFINFPLCTSLLLGVCLWCALVGASPSESANPGSGSWDYRCLVSMEYLKGISSNLSLVWYLLSELEIITE